MLILAIATLWILVIPALVVTGLAAASRVLAGRADRRRQAAARIWNAGSVCDDHRAQTFTRRPGHRLVLGLRRRTLSRR